MEYLKQKLSAIAYVIAFVAFCDITTIIVAASLRSERVLWAVVVILFSSLHAMIACIAWLFWDPIHRIAALYDLLVGPDREPVDEARATVAQVRRLAGELLGRL